MPRPKIILIGSGALVLIGIALSAFEPVGVSSIDYAIVVVLIVGLIGLLVGIVYLVKNRRSSS